MKLFRIPLLVLCVSALCLGPTYANDDEEEAERQPALHVALHWIGSLTQGQPDFTEQPLGVIQQDPGEDGYPVFGQSDRPFFPWGSADEVIELVKYSVAPTFWENQYGANIASSGESGKSMLVVRATRAIHDQISKYLTTLEQDAAPVRVELLALQTTPTALSDMTIRERDTWTDEAVSALPGKHVRASLLTTDRQNATVARGTHRALVVGTAPTVKDGSAVEIPTVQIGRYGVVASVKPTLAPGGTVRTQLDVSVGAMSRLDARNWPKFAAHDDQIAMWHADVNLRLDHWQFMGAAASNRDQAWGLFARVSTTADYQSPARARMLPKAKSGDAAMDARRTPINDLWGDTRDRFPAYRLLRSSFEDAPDPMRHGPFTMPFWHPDNLVELIQHTAGGESDWENGTIMVQNGQLLVRNQPRIHDAIDGILRVIRAQCSESIRLDVQVLEQPSADPSRRRGIPGTSAVARVNVRPGQRNFSSAAGRHTYVGGFHVMMRDGAFVASPTQFDVDLGLTVEARATPDLAGEGVHLELRFNEQSLQEPTASTKFRVGTIELPAVRMYRGQTGVRLRFGETATVFEADNGIHRRVVLVTARSSR